MSDENTQAPVPAAPVEQQPDATQAAQPVQVDNPDVSEDFVPQSEGDEDGVPSLDDGKD